MHSAKSIVLALFLLISACSSTIKPPYDVDDPNTRIAWCPSTMATSQSCYLNTAYFFNDTYLTRDDRLLVSHGAFCTLLETRVVEGYIWTDELYEETRLSEPVDVVFVECDNRYRRGGNGTIELFGESYKTEGWTFPNAVLTIEEWDDWIGSQ